MPIYEYQCQSCGHHLERLQKISDPPLSECPQCQGELRKLVSAPAFQFKGSGWYVTDYADKKKGSAKEEGGSKGGGSESSPSPSSGSDSGSSSAQGEGGASKAGSGSSSPAASGASKTKD